MARRSKSNWLSCWNAAAGMAALLVLFGLAGCDAFESIKPPIRTVDSPVPGATEETADNAARAFFGAIARKETEKAISLVLAADREKARKELENPPQLPEELLLTTSVLGNHARVKCTTPGFSKLGLDLIYIDNQWWVVLQ